MNISIEKLAQDKALAEALSASQFSKGMSPADILFAHYAVGAPRGWNMAQTIQNTHLERVSLRVKRRGLKAMGFSWTMDQAKRANLANSNTWRQYPERMLAARLHTEVASVLFPDIVCQTSGANTYSTEEASFFDSRDHRPAPAPAPKKNALDELRERLADMGIPNDDARVYLQGKKIAAPTNSEEVEAILDDHFSIDSPFFTLHPHLLGDPQELNFGEL
jgi:hypothetical protein